jgi:hypothetical protein
VTVLSLLLCAAAVALWVRSYAVSDSFSHAQLDDPGDMHHSTGWDIETGEGGVAVSQSRFHSTARLDELPSGWVWEPREPVNLTDVWVGIPTTFATRMGFFRTDAQSATPYGTSMRLRSVGFPVWTLAALTAVLPAARLYRRVGRRSRAGRCRTCGYDLRATPDRCPECGTPATTPGRGVAARAKSNGLNQATTLGTEITQMNADSL